MIELPTGCAHMPFVNEQGEGVYCVGEPALFGGVDFRAWRPAFMGGEALEIPQSLNPDHPLRVICNPVYQDGFLSFVRGGALYTIDYFHRHTVKRISCVTGFMWKGGRSYHVEGNQIRDDYAPGFIDTPFERVLRMVPAIDTGGLLLTGASNNTFFSAIYRNERWYRVMVENRDVYKCCQLEGGLIHTVREEGVDRRRLEFAPDYIMVPMEGLQSASAGVNNTTKEP